MNQFIINEIKKRLDKFNQDHPRLAPYFDTVKAKALKEGNIVEIKVTDAEGMEYVANFRLTADDVESIKLMDLIPM